MIQAAPQAAAAPVVDPTAPSPLQRMQRKTTNAQRLAAAQTTAAKRAAAAAKVTAPLAAGATAAANTTLALGAVAAPGVMNPLGTPDYLGGVVPNYANTPLLQKFVHSLPGLGSANANDLGQFIPIAVADTTTFPGSDYYQLGLVEYSQQVHKDLPGPTTFRGYRDLAPTADGNPHYLGPFIIARRDRPVRVKFTNQLPTGAAGHLFLPVDTTSMGAGVGPLGGTELYTQNRAELHLHGGATPWISDGTPHQWITPAGETTSYAKGVSQQNVPDMPDPGAGSATYFYTNQQSARMMFYHDHSYGLTRLNVYAGEAAGYLVTDAVEDSLIDASLIPGLNAGVYRYGIPLVIQDKTFVPDATRLAAQDPTWDVANWGGPGSLWFPHVYMPNQNPADITGANPMGRWDYGPWFWPPVTTLVHGPIPGANPGDPETPGIPNPTMVPESFMDTPLVNGTPYPTLTVQPKAYRFRILNAANDRMWNLSFFQADPANPTEVKMVPAAPGLGLPANWPMDGRDGGTPDPTLQGPSIIQIGNEGGLLPAPVVLPPQPVTYNYNRRDIVVLNVANHGLFMGPAERADVVVDFSQYAGKTLILYNDAPAPVPAFDTRYDFYTGDPDQTSTGGAPTTPIGYGPNTRTIMQIQVASGAADPAFNVAALQAAFVTSATNTSVFSASQDAPIVPQAVYGAAYNTTLPDNWSRIQSTSMTYTPMGAVAPITMPLQPKAIQELFELDYGRMNATLGVELPFTNFNTQTTIPLGYTDPVTENLADGQVQIWKITHNGVDTHPVHFHLFNVQVINRVGWDGAVRFPDPNEVGWKETVRMNPLEDAIVAIRPVAQMLPFNVPDSVRPNDPTKAVGATLSVTNPLDGNALTVTNDLINFGWEYVWHCHILGHEENDFMRTMMFTVPNIVISGTVKDAGGLGLAGVTLAASGGGTATTAADGTYTLTHTSHWNGSVTATKLGYTFTPASRIYANTVTDQTAQDYVATAAPIIQGLVYVAVSPSTPVAGVTLTLSNGGGTVTTDATGNYLSNVPSGWTGTVVPSLAGYTFAPLALSFTAVTAPQIAQNFAATPVVTISGTIASGANGIPGVAVAFSNNGGSVTTDASGNYSQIVPAGWTGVVVPTLAGYVFTPVSHSYTSVLVNTPSQNFAAQAVVVIGGRVLKGGIGSAGVLVTYTPGGTTTTDASGNYTMTLPAPYSGTVTPSKLNAAYTPAARTYIAQSANLTTENFIEGAIATVSGQITSGGTALAGVNVTFSNGGGTAVTDANGNYSLTLSAPWTGTATPAKAGFAFTPVAIAYTSILLDQANQNYTAMPVIVIGGKVATTTAGLQGVTMTFTPGGAATTDASGNYTMTLPSGWSGTVTPTLAGYYFAPASRSYTSATVNFLTENYTATNAVTIYGLVSRNTVPLTPLAGVTITFSNGGGSVVTDAQGLFTHYVPVGYSGTATPSLAGFIFTPASRNYANLRTNTVGQTFTAQAVVVVTGNVTNAGLSLAGVRVAFSNVGSATTDASGNYTMTLNSGYSGTATASLNGYQFSAPVVLTNVTAGLANVNFFTVKTVSGRIVNSRGVRLAGVFVTDSHGATATTNTNGNYTLTVPAGGTGTVTPSLTGYTFTPAFLSYTAIAGNLTGMNFTAK
jgi:FtsP/CotA-like multicopper oxidase with cupredoxin domain